MDKRNDIHFQFGVSLIDFQLKFDTEEQCHDHLFRLLRRSLVAGNFHSFIVGKKIQLDRLGQSQARCPLISLRLNKI